MAIPEQQLGDLSFRGVMLLGAYFFYAKTLDFKGFYTIFNDKGSEVT